MPLRNYLNENMTEEERLLSFKRKQHIHHNESLAPFGERNNYAFHFSDIQHVHQTHAYTTFRHYCTNSGNVPVERFLTSLFMLKLFIILQVQLFF